MSWRPHFPLKAPREEQIAALDAAEAWLEGPDKFLVLELPTGVGKSAVAMALGRMLAARGDSTYVLTSQKILQDQYVGDFNVHDIRSSSEFSCHSMQGTCGEASRARHAAELPPCSSCPYKIAKEAFVDSPIGVTNYAYILNESTYVGQLKKRRLLVLDEAHNAEREVRSWATVTVSEEWSAKELRLKVPGSLQDAEMLRWIQGPYAAALGLLKDHLEEELARAFKARKPSVPALSRKFAHVDRHLCGVERLAKLGVEEVSMLWTPKGLELRPLVVGPMMHEALYSLGDKVLLMSATILDREEFFDSAGVPAESKMLALPSPLTKEAYGVKYYPVARVTRDGLDDRGKMMLVKAVRAALRDNPNHKGIIHTGSYDLLQEMQRGLGGEKRLLWQNTAADRKPILEEHFSSPEPTVLVSPGMTEGIDLRGDFSRFQVILKVPWPSLGDPIVKRMKALRPRWYAWSTAKTLVQATGRSVRSSDDWARTYILDSSYQGFLNSWGDMLPDWIKP